MFCKEKEFRLKDRRNAFLRNPSVNDAENMPQFIIKVSGETDFPMKFSEEFAGFTPDQEKAFLRANCDNKSGPMIICLINGRAAGSCQISSRIGEENRRRASVVIAPPQEFQNLGIGTRILEEMFQAAEEHGNVRQVKLDFIEGNKRARGLYEKMGFQITGIKSGTVRMEGGSLVNEYMMVKRL